MRFKDYPEFTPNVTPERMFRSGAFGGTYWRPIHSKVVGKDLQNQHKKYSFLKGIPADKMTRPFDEYDKDINKYKVKVGTTLQYWESKGWIHKSQPYGWVQWYCDFYNGKRNKEEDEYQIKRWLNTAGPNSRFRKALVNEIKRKGGKYNDASISPKKRQTLLHWGVELVPSDMKS